MVMIRIVAKNYVKADKVEVFTAMAQELVNKTRTEDAGCISYELFQDLKNPQVLTMFEEWKDNDCLTKHMNSAHFKEAMTAFQELLEKPGEADVYRKLI
jgi:quinol monooxygenase YgiN